MRGPRSFTFPSFVPFSFISMKSERAWVPLLPRRLVDHSRMFEMKFENSVRYPILNILKVRQIRNDFFKLTFLPKNERTNSTLLFVDLFSFFFLWKKVKTPKRQFEINWPLITLFSDRLFSLREFILCLSFWTKIAQKKSQT